MGNLSPFQSVLELELGLSALDVDPLHFLVLPITTGLLPFNHL
jgi:hypothetical protein